MDMDEEDTEWDDQAETGERESATTQSPGSPSDINRQQETETEEKAAAAAIEASAGAQRPAQIYVADILLEYLRYFNEELARATAGIGSDLEYVIRGKRASADEIIATLEGRDPEEEQGELRRYLHLAPYAALYLPVLAYPRYALELVLAGSGIALLYVLLKPPVEDAEKRALYSHIRLRDATPLLTVLGDMMGFAGAFLTDDRGRNELRERIDPIVKELTGLGGSLDINTIQRIAYEAKYLEGLALFIGHIGLTIDDYRDYILSPVHAAAHPGALYPWEQELLGEGEGAGGGGLGPRTGGVTNAPVY